MAEVAKKHQDMLTDIKEHVRSWKDYFKDNNVRFYFFKNFVFNTSVSSESASILRDLQKPQIECNMLEAYISRLRGEFATQEPNIKVRAADGLPPQFQTQGLQKTIDVVEGHLNAIFLDSSNDELEYNIYTDCLGGGFSVAEVYTDYLNEFTFEQGIFIRKEYDPTMCGFDPLARESHKGDGRFCYKLFPYTKKEFARLYPKFDVDSLTYTRNFDGYTWSYMNEQSEKIILICDYYMKKYKKRKIVQLNNNEVMFKDDYQAMVDAFEQDPFSTNVPPPVTAERWSEEQYIVRYRVVENEVLEYEETNFKHLPLVFIDGNSQVLKQTAHGSIHQMTRPYVYHAKDVQRVKNFTFQTAANEIENMQMHQWLAPLESVPEHYQDSWSDPQKTDVLFYNQFLDENPDVPLKSPEPVPRIPTPPIVGQMYELADKTTQMILGSYDSALGINNNQLSGKAIQAGAMTSNMAALPYNVGYIKGINRICEIIVDLIPKYYTTPRTIPIRQKDGKRSYISVNSPGDVSVQYDPYFLGVHVEVGVNFAVQKQQAMQELTSLMQASETFAEFMNQQGLPILLDNLDIRGIDGLKEQAELFMQQKQKNAAEEAQMQMQLNPVMATKEIEGAKIRQREQEANQNFAAKMQDNAIKKQEADNDTLETFAKIQDMGDKSMMEKARIDAENARTFVDLKEIEEKAQEE